MLADMCLLGRTQSQLGLVNSSGRKEERSKERKNERMKHKTRERENTEPHRRGLLSIEADPKDQATCRSTAAGAICSLRFLAIRLDKLRKP